MAGVGAAVPSAYSPVSDDVELEDILRGRSQGVPSVVIRKDSNSADTTTRPTDADDATRLCTPAPIATFEVLSDVEESDMDEVTSLDAAQTAVDSAASSATETFCVGRHADDGEANDLQANGSLQQKTTDLTSESYYENTAEIHHSVDSELVREELGGSRDEESQPIRVGVPTLVFEDVDANNETSLSSPECLVNNDDDDDDDGDCGDNNNGDIDQQMWQWTAEHHQGTVTW